MIYPKKLAVEPKNVVKVSDIAIEIGFIDILLNLLPY